MHARVSFIHRQYGTRGHTAAPTPSASPIIERSSTARARARLDATRRPTRSHSRATTASGTRAGYAPVRDRRQIRRARGRARRRPRRTSAALANCAAAVLWGAGLAAVSSSRPCRDAGDHAQRAAPRRRAERIGAGDLPCPDVPAAATSSASSASDGARCAAARRARREDAADARGIAHEPNPLAGMTLFADILEDELPRPTSGAATSRDPRELATSSASSTTSSSTPAGRAELATVDVPSSSPRSRRWRRPVTIEVAARPGATRPSRPTRTAPRAPQPRAQPVQAAHAARTPRRAEAVGSHHGAVGSSVWNRGGIPPETAASCSSRYTTREKGTGLGLAFVRDIAVDHGGRVEVASADGETTVSIVSALVPRRMRPRWRHPDHRRQRHDPPRPRDHGQEARPRSGDRPTACRVAASRRGAPTSSSPISRWRAARATRPRVASSAIHADVPIMIITGFGTVETAVEAMKLGASTSSPSRSRARSSSSRSLARRDLCGERGARKADRAGRLLRPRPTEVRRARRRRREDGSLRGPSRGRGRATRRCSSTARRTGKSSSRARSIA